MPTVLVVDDSVVIRRLIVDALGAVPGIKVVGTAANGKLAQAKIDQLCPDVVTMDIEMPEMDGITAVRELRKRYARLPVIMFSTLTAAGASATLDALAAGATDYVTKPSNTGSFAASQAMVRDQLVPRILALAARATPRPPMPVYTRPHPVAAALPSEATGTAGAQRAGAIGIITIGSSTGGPDALTRVIGALPATLGVPIVITQHMPPVFTRMFAERLNRLAKLTVVEAADGMTIQPNWVYIAPGDRHLSVLTRGPAMVVKLTDAPPENSCRPAVDVLFRSVAKAYGRAALAVILTGMGQDGKRGAEELLNAGAEIVAQDEASSVVWGMPGAIVGARLAHCVLPLDSIAPHIVSRVGSRPAAGPANRPKVVTG